MNPTQVVVAGIGGYLPRRVVTNADLASTVETTDDWIVERTGIRQRHLVEDGENTVSMAAAAARIALDAAGVAHDGVEAVILATATPDDAFPASAVRVLNELGAIDGFGFDISAACSGFIYALSVAEAFIASGRIRNALVIGSEVYSRLMDWSDRRTCVLFGDGAGAVFLRAEPQGEGQPKRGILSTHLHADGSLGDLLYVDGAVGQRERSGYLHMNGREVFRHAVGKLSGAVSEALEANGLTAEDIDWLVPHQANLRIIDGVGRKLNLPADRVVVTVDRHANTSAASIPLALYEAHRDGRIQPGQLVLLEALGGGMTWGSALLRM